jgi:CubicO group peptidase (beta-lactamase class C family)
MSKVLTALGVMSAVDDGRLDLDAPIRESIPALSLEAPETDELTLRRLLSQQTGLRDYLVVDGPREDSGLADFASGAELADNVDYMNPPGVFWNYSNPNYYLAGRALEVGTQTPYRDAVRERVLAPLHMERSFFLGSEALDDGDYSSGYGVMSLDPEVTTFEDLGPDAYDNAWARPAGYAFSNVLDWAKLMQLVLRGDEHVISEASLDEVTSTQISTRSIYADLRTTALGLGDDYGFGLGVSSGFFMDRTAEPDLYYAAPYIGHGGDIPGFASTFAVFPSTGFGIVVFSNRDGVRPVDAMRYALETFGELPAPSAPPPRDPDPSLFSGYAGTYRDAGGNTLRVTLEGDALRVAGPLLDSTGISFEPVLEPTSTDNFSLWVQFQGQRLPLEVTFIDDPDGGYWFRSRVAVARQELPAVAAAPSTQR